MRFLIRARTPSQVAPGLDYGLYPTLIESPTLTIKCVTFQTMFDNSLFV